MLNNAKMALVNFRRSHSCLKSKNISLKMKLSFSLCSGVWASGAPLIARVDHREYKELSGAAYRSAGGQDCYNTIETGFAQIEQYFADGRNSEIDEIFHTCDPITSPADVALFFSLISEIFSIIPQFNQ